MNLASASSTLTVDDLLTKSNLWAYQLEIPDPKFACVIASWENSQKAPNALLSLLNADPALKHAVYVVRYKYEIFE